MTDTGWEATFVLNMVRTRDRLRMSQTELAKKMSSRGFAFHQPTIARVESGSRPLRLNEAQAITEILFGGDWEQAVQPVGELALRAVVIEQSAALTVETATVLISMRAEIARLRQLGVNLLTELARYRQACELEGVMADADVSSQSDAALALFLATLTQVATLDSEDPLTEDRLRDLEWLKSQVDERWEASGGHP